MYDADRGQKILADMHEITCKMEDVDLWYSDEFYDVESCWSRTAIYRLGSFAETFEDYTDLIAYLMDGSDAALANEMFKDGFGYRLGAELDWMHQSL